MTTNARYNQIECPQCGWVGSDDELKTIILNDSDDIEEPDYYEEKVCPMCEEII